MYGSSKKNFATASAQQLACTFLNLNLISVVVVDYCIFKILFLCIPNVVKYLLCIKYSYSLQITNKRYHKTNDNHDTTKAFWCLSEQQ